MNRAKAKNLVQETKNITDSFKNKYDFITDDLLRNIQENNLNVADVLKIISVLQEDVYQLSNRIVSVKDAQGLETIPWSVGDVIICPWQNHFVLFHYKNFDTILFKDSSGKLIPPELKQWLPASKTVISNTVNDGEYNHLMPISNIELIVKVPLNTFSPYRGFTKNATLESFRARMLEALKALQLTGYIGKELLEIEDKTEFKAALKEYIQECLSYNRLSELSKIYQDILESESKKIENNGELMNTHKIENARQQMLSETKKMAATSKHFKSDNKEQLLRIEKDFPKESTHFKNIFRYLQDYKVDRQFMSSIEMISVKLNLSYADMQQFFVMQKESNKQSAGESIQSKNRKTTKDSILSKFSKSSVVKAAKPDPSIRTLPELLSTLKRLNEFTARDVTNLDALYAKTMSIFKNTWATKQTSDINKWAKKIRGKLQPKDMCEAMAVCIRAYQIVSNGIITLRDIQILSALMFMSISKGNFAEISTGEGKTVIIATLAVIKVLEGKRVDIITSNEVLANEGLNTTREFYYLFDVHASQNNFDRSYTTGPRACYNYDIVYGNIGNFQFDYLRDSFEDNKTRDGRGFDFLILDEVDSLTIDNGTYIAKLAQPFPGVECLRYVYIKIWILLQKAEEAYKNKIYEQMEKMANNSQGKSDEQMQQEADECYIQSIKNMTNELKQIIKEGHPLDVPIIPDHLKDYCASMLDRWINNAIYAKYYCHEKEAYILKEVQKPDSNKKELMVVPVDYANTGVTLSNTIWSNGLHQFVQLKHNMRLTSETLTASFISNLGYIKLYQNNMYGMTGTLGSKAEQEFLSSIYELQYLRVPTFKEKQFQELDGIVVRDVAWANTTILNAYLFAKEGRSVLIICETISDVEVLRDNLEALIDVEDIRDWVKTRYYYDETFADLVVQDKVGPSEIIIATNIAGRGTDFKTTKQLELNGGLHVCVAFLPCNERVEMQAFGRTARKGNFGTAQLLLRESDVTAIGFQIEEGTTMQDIKRHRDQIELQKLTSAKDGKVKEVLLQDELFQKFAKTYRDFLQSQRDKPGGIYLTLDLKEIWAFWLRSRKFDGSEEIQYQLFLDLANSTLNGNVSFNPFYAIKQADYYLKNDQLSDAKMALQQAMALSKSESYMYPAFMKLFETCMLDGHAVMHRFKEAMAKLVFIKVSDNSVYKTESYKALENAHAGVSAEIDYITKFILENPDFFAILAQTESDEIEKNILLKHIHSRYYALVTFQNHITSLMAEIKDVTKDGITIEGKIDNYLKQLKPEYDDQRFLKEHIYEEELVELNNVGFSTFYSIRKVYGVNDVVLRGAQAQIAAGIVIFIGCCFFPPALIVGGPAAGALIGEGLTDIVIDLIQQGSVEFDIQSYIKSKCVSYLISAITIGFTLVAQSVKLLKLAAKTLQGLSKVLQKSSALKGVFIKVATFLQKYAIKLANRIQKLKLSKIALSEVTLARSMAIRMGLKHVGYATGINLAGALIGEFVVSKAIAAILDASRGKILADVRKVVNAKFDGKLTNVKGDLVRSTAHDLCNGTVGQLSWEIFKDTVVSLTQACRSWKIKIAGFTLYSITNMSEIGVYTNQFCNTMLDLIKNETEVKNSPAIIEELKSFIAETITNQIYKTIMALAQGATHNFIVNPIMSRLIQSSIKKASNKGYDDPSKQQSFKDIANAYKLLGLDETATPQEINKAYRKLALKHHPDSRISANADLFIAIKDAKDLLMNLQKPISSKSTKPKPVLQLPAPPDLPMAHKGNIKTLSRKLGIPIEVVHATTNKKTQFGSDYGSDALVVYYKPPENDTPGHYFLPGISQSFTPSAKNNCLYDTLSYQMNKQGIHITPSELRAQATSLSFANLKFDAINKLSSIFNNKHTGALYNKIQEHILVGGVFKSNPLPLNSKGEGRYPSGTIKITTSSKTKDVVDKLGAHFAQHFQAVDNVRAFNAKQTKVKNELILTNVPTDIDTLPIMTYPPTGLRKLMEKSEFMMGALHVEFVGGNELNIMTTSGTTKFKDRLVKVGTVTAKDIVNDDEYRFRENKYKPENMKLEIDGFTFINTDEINIERVYDLVNGQLVTVEDPNGDLGRTKNSGCAAIKMLDYVATYMKDNPGLTIKGDINMVEAYFQPGTQGDPVIEDSCKRCKILLPHITHTD